MIKKEQGQKVKVLLSLGACGSHHQAPGGEKAGGGEAGGRRSSSRSSELEEGTAGRGEMLPTAQIPEIAQTPQNWVFGPLHRAACVGALLSEGGLRWLHLSPGQQPSAFLQGQLGTWQQRFPVPRKGFQCGDPERLWQG